MVNKLAYLISIVSWLIKRLLRLLTLLTSRRKFYNELSVQETSLEGICNTFIHHGAEFKCYVTFLSNFDHGLRILSSYGGSFFTDRQQEIEDELSLEEHYGHVKQRLVDYDRLLKEVYMCSQKEYLHGVSIVKVSTTPPPPPPPTHTHTNTQLAITSNMLILI